MYENVAHMIKP